MTELGRKVLVTGGETTLGRAIAEALARDPAVHSVLCVHAPHAPSSALPEGAPRVMHVPLDLGRPREVRDLLFSERARAISAVVHAPSAFGQPPPSAHARRGVVQATEHLLRVCDEQPQIARFVYVGSGSVYRIDTDEPTLIDENHPLELAASAPQSVRERIEADLVVCARIGVSRLSIAVLRCAEILAPGTGGQLHDYLGSRVCLRPLGYDAMLNVLSLHDVANAARLATLSHERGVFNIPGLDTLPLTELIHRAGKLGVPLPGPALAPLYRLRALTTAFRFRYAPERQRFHFGAILDGREAKRAFDYAPARRVRFDALLAPRDAASQADPSRSS